MLDSSTSISGPRLDAGPLVSPEWLLDHLDDPALRLIDVRFYLDGRDPRQAYRSGHLPGAVLVTIHDGLASPPGPGRHPLPTREAFQAGMRRAGLSMHQAVVVYDDQRGSVAGRLWWLLRAHGFDRVALLDGGLEAWPGPLETEAVEVAEGDFVAGPMSGRVVDFEAVLRRDPELLPLDARAPERYRGETEPVDPIAGHIPGALNLPWTENLGPDGRFLPPAELRARFARLGVTDGRRVIAYCGSGISTCHNLIALELAGLPGAALYPGSWSDWSRREGAPIATGEEP